MGRNLKPWFQSFGNVPTYDASSELEIEQGKRREDNYITYLK